MAIQASTGPAVGDLFAGLYELHQELGRGGFGVVFRARRKGSSQDLAIKILIPGNDPAKAQEMRQRFEREALMISQLNNPHTIRQYGFSETEDGTMYFVMEMLKGKNLDDILIKEGPRNEQQVIHIAQGVLQSLAEAHARNIIHRDLKPANLMLCEANGVNDFVKLLDFGIAKTTTGDQDLTAAGQALGSPRYMAPEILRSQPATPCSDVYALGLTLAECLTGVPIVSDPNVVMQARMQLAPEPLPLPDHVKKTAFWPWLSAALEKDPAQRYPNAGAMLQALNHYLHNPIQFTPQQFIVTTPVSPDEQATLMLDDREFRAEIDRIKQSGVPLPGVRPAGFNSGPSNLIPLSDQQPQVGTINRGATFSGFAPPANDLPQSQQPQQPTPQQPPGPSPLINDNTRTMAMVGAALLMGLIVLLVIKFIL